MFTNVILFNEARSCKCLSLCRFTAGHALLAGELNMNVMYLGITGDMVTCCLPSVCNLTLKEALQIGESVLGNTKLSQWGSFSAE